MVMAKRHGSSVCDLDDKLGSKFFACSYFSTYGSQCCCCCSCCISVGAYIFDLGWGHRLLYCWKLCLELEVCLEGEPEFDLGRGHMPPYVLSSVLLLLWHSVPETPHCDWVMAWRLLAWVFSQFFSICRVRYVWSSQRGVIEVITRATL